MLHPDPSTRALRHESAKAQRSFRLRTAKSADERAWLYGWCWAWRAPASPDAPAWACRRFMNVWNSARSNGLVRKQSTPEAQAAKTVLSLGAEASMKKA